MFFNDVLPYASLDEPRDPWRETFTNSPPKSSALHQCLRGRADLEPRIVQARESPLQPGAQAQQQSPKESIEQGKPPAPGWPSFCGRLRAVGVPARVVGVPEWVHKEGQSHLGGNLDGEWFFTGADEYDKHGPGSRWFMPTPP